MKQNAYEMFLDRLDPSWRSDQLAFFRVLAEHGPDGVPVLAERLCLASCSPDLRRLGLEASYYFAWPEWVPMLARILKYEKDPTTFETGARALGRLGTPEALATLKELYQFRGTLPFRRILEQVLNESDPVEAFRHNLSRLLQGSTHANEANEGAHQLEKLLTPDSVALLQPLASHPDLLVYRHALRLLSQIPSREAAEFLLHLLVEAHEDVLAEREVRALLNAFRSLPRPDVKGRVVRALADRWQEREPTLALDLASEDPQDLGRAIQVLKQTAGGLLDTFLLDTLEAALDEKPAQLARLLTQAGDQAAQRTRRLEFALDTAASGLAQLAHQGLIPPEDVLEPLANLFRSGAGRAGIATALASLVPPSDEAILHLLLNDTDGAHRLAALEALGSRQDPALRPALAQLRKDPIADVAHRALWHLGHLPDPEAQARTWLVVGDPEDILAGLQFIQMHHLTGLVPDLLRLVASEPQEILLFAALQTLGGLGSLQAAEHLFGLLHSGQPLKLQLALAEALRDFADPDVAMALCERATELASPDLCAVGIEALARAHGSEASPLKASYASLLIKLTRTAWESRNPWALRRRVAEALTALHFPQPIAWNTLVNLFQQTLSEKRNPGTVSSEDLAHLNTCARALAKRVNPHPSSTVARA